MKCVDILKKKHEPRRDDKIYGIISTGYIFTKPGSWIYLLPEGLIWVSIQASMNTMAKSNTNIHIKIIQAGTKIKA